MDIERIEELARRASERAQVQYLHFLDPADCAHAHDSANRVHVRAEFFGGHSQAERMMCAFLPDWEDPENLNWPLVGLYIQWNARYAAVAHRDVLGAILALGIKREVLGDILVGEGYAICFVSEDMAGYLLENLLEIGHASVRIEPYENQAQIPARKMEMIHATLASLRLDAMVAAAYRISRTKAVEAIRAGKVKHNHREETHTDAKVEPGDMLSMQGFGRAQFLEMGNHSQRGRIHVDIGRLV